METVLNDTVNHFQYLAVFGIGLFMLTALISEYSKIAGLIAWITLIVLAISEWVKPGTDPFMILFIFSFVLFGLGGIVHWIYFDEGDDQDGSEPNEHL